MGGRAAESRRALRNPPGSGGRIGGAAGAGGFAHDQFTAKLHVHRRQIRFGQTLEHNLVGGGTNAGGRLAYGSLMKICS